MLRHNRTNLLSCSTYRINKYVCILRWPHMLKPRRDFSVFEPSNCSLLFMLPLSSFSHSSYPSITISYSVYCQILSLRTRAAGSPRSQHLAVFSSWHTAQTENYFHRDPKLPFFCARFCSLSLFRANFWLVCSSRAHRWPNRVSESLIEATSIEFLQRKPSQDIVLASGTLKSSFLGSNTVLLCYPLQYLH